MLYIYTLLTFIFQVRESETLRKNKVMTRDSCTYIEEAIETRISVCQGAILACVFTRVAIHPSFH
jgi:hypothetical protein